MVIEDTVLQSNLIFLYPLKKSENHRKAGGIERNQLHEMG